MGSKEATSEKDSARTEAPREVEMKLSVDPDALQDVLKHPLVAKARQAPEQGGDFHAVYFDTDEQDLRRAGLSLRVRRHGDAWIQTVKADGDAKGLVLDRDEWESEVRGEALDWRAIEGTALGQLLDGNKKLKGRIRPAFTIRTERQAFLVDRDRTRIELVLDRAEVRRGERTLRFGEIELELKSGQASTLFDVALDLAEAAPVRLSLATKSGRGYELLEDGPPNAVKADKIALQPGLTSAEAFRILARSCVSQAVRNEALVREHRIPEAVHQFRVGLRRLRAAVSQFSDLLSDDESRSVRAELRWMNHSLGPVRDLDVLVARLRETPDHEQSLAAAERRRQEAYEQLLARMDEPRFRRGMLAAAAWIEAGRWLAAPDPALRERRGEPVERRAEKELAKRWKRVMKRAKRLAELEPEARHEVRIEIKKLRYGTEFFASLFPGKKAKRRRKHALQVLEEFQEVLGELNDIAVGGHLLVPTATRDRGGAARRDEQRAEELLERAEALYGELAATKPFWA